MAGEPGMVRSARRRLPGTAPGSDAARTRRSREMMATYRTIFCGALVLLATLFPPARAQEGVAPIGQLQSLGAIGSTTQRPLVIRPLDPPGSATPGAARIRAPAADRRLPGALPPTTLSEDYARRAGDSLTLRPGESLRQFGYRSFRADAPAPAPITGAINESYRLGVGDEVNVTLQGQTWQNILSQVDRNGRIVVPGLPPIAAAGRTFGEVRAELRAIVERTMLGTEIYVSVGRLRSINVTVVGEVRFPGLYYMTSLSTLMDVLVRAGGPKRSGSLRSIRIDRSGSVRTVDLYELLLHGVIRQDIALREGDRIVVPTIGPTIAVAGHVKRPGIFELPVGTRPSLDDAVAYAGGPIRPQGNRFVRISIDKDGRDLIQAHPQPALVRVRNGDIVSVQPAANLLVDHIRLRGAVRVPGMRPLQVAGSLRALIPETGVLRDDAYLPFAVVRRVDRNTLKPVYIPFDLGGILSGAGDLALQSKDEVIVISRRAVAFLGSADVRAARSGQIPPSVALRQSDEAWARSGWIPPSVALRQSDEAGARSGRIPPSVALRQSDEAWARSGRIPPSVALRQSDEAWARSGRIPPSVALRQSDEAGARSTGFVWRESDGTNEGDGKYVRTEYSCAGLLELLTAHTAGGGSPLHEVDGGIRTLQPKSVIDVIPCPYLYEAFPDLLFFLLKHSVVVTGAVVAPGLYPIAGESTVASMVALAGGPTHESHPLTVNATFARPLDGTGTVDVVNSTVLVDRRSGGTAADASRVRAGDSLRIAGAQTPHYGTVELVGQFRRPGRYMIRRGERLSEVMARAGGLTGIAYPAGAVFLRTSAAEIERQANVRLAEQLTFSTVAKIGDFSRGVAEVTKASQTLIDRLRSAPVHGRIVVHVDPALLSARSDLNFFLEPGDRLMMPARPTTVRVSGAVLNPGAYQFLSDLRSEDYIELAGGLDDSAEEGRMFVVFPNGAAERLKLSSWNYSRTKILPGSSIVVPRDPAPLGLGVIASEVTEVLSRVSLTAAAIASIGR